MGKIFNFWWMCVKRAAPGNSSFANDWQWVFGAPIWTWAIGTSTVAGLAKYFEEGQGSMSTGSPALDAFLVATVVFVITWLVVFMWRVFSSASKFYYEEKDRADALQQQLAHVKNLLRYRLYIIVEIEEFKKKPNGRIRIENTSDEPLQYGPAVLSAAFQDDEPKVLNCKEHILSPHKWGYYSFEFDEKAMAKDCGYVIFIADIDYGSPGTRTRRLHSKIEVEYAVNDHGFIGQWAAKTSENQEIAISG
jgi:hypothetical protein